MSTEDDQFQEKLNALAGNIMGQLDVQGVYLMVLRRPDPNDSEARVHNACVWPEDNEPALVDVLTDAADDADQAWMEQGGKEKEGTVQ